MLFQVTVILFIVIVDIQKALSRQKSYIWNDSKRSTVAPWRGKNMYTVWYATLYYASYINISLTGQAIIEWQAI